MVYVHKYVWFLDILYKGNQPSINVMCLLLQETIHWINCLMAYISSGDVQTYTYN